MNALDAIIAIVKAAPGFLLDHPLVAVVTAVGFGALFAALHIAARRGGDR